MSWTQLGPPRLDAHLAEETGDTELQVRTGIAHELERKWYTHS